VTNADIWVLGEGGGPQVHPLDMERDTRSFNIRMGDEKYILRVAERILRMEVQELKRFLQVHAIAQRLRDAGLGNSLSIGLDEFGNLKTQIEPI